MQEFKDWKDIPDYFEGKCKIKQDNTILNISNGFFHCSDGPAIEWSSGTKEWYENGEKHRLDGPASELYDGEKRWYIRGERYSKEEFEKHPEVILYKAGLEIFV
jgi:hypothetical protein